MATSSAATNPARLLARAAQQDIVPQHHGLQLATGVVSLDPSAILQDIRQQWGQYWYSMQNCDFAALVRQQLPQVPAAHCEPVRAADVQHALQKGCLKQTPGFDGITVEQLRAAGPSCHQPLG